MQNSIKKKRKQKLFIHAITSNKLTISHENVSFYKNIYLFDLEFNELTITYLHYFLQK